jgi:hypothetical protein
MNLSVGAVLWLWLQPILPAPAADVAPPAFALFWQPPGTPAEVARAREAFARAISARKGPPPVERTAPASQPTQLRGRLSAAVQEYRSFKFAETAAACSELVRAVESAGGGDLDARALADVYLYRGLARLELGQQPEAWDDVVRAVRIDGTRLVDPAEMPPRAAAMFRRALGEVANAPHAQLEVHAPADAQVLVDGHAAAGPAAVALGPHLVRVETPGFEPWSSVVPVTAAQQKLEPPMRALQPPDPDALADAARAAGIQRGRVVMGSVRRTPAGWKFLARVVDLPGGQAISEDALLGEAAIDHTVGTVLSHLLDPSVAPPRRDPPPVVTEPSPWYKRWWIWALAGGVATGVAIGVTAASTSGSSAHTLGSVGGPPPPTQP